MKTIKTISGKTEQEVWTTLRTDLLKEDEFYYHALIKQGKREIELLIDIDPGGGFEGGSELTRLSTVLHHDDEFKFAVHDMGFIDSIGKFLGMQDVEVGYKQLDEHLVIKTNDKDRAHHIFADADIRKVFTLLEKFNCGIYTESDDDRKAILLELSIDAGVDEPETLRTIYHAFHKLASILEAGHHTP